VPFYRTFIQEFTAITQAHACLWARRLDRGSTGPLSCQTLTPWSVVVKVVNSLLARNTYRPNSFRSYRPPGLFLHAGWIPFKKDKGGSARIFIVVDRFTKWIKVKPTASITAAKAMEFIKEITNRFGVTNNIITNNGTQFTAREFKDFCADSGIKVNHASISHL
jgi:hypothetical protein